MSHKKLALIGGLSLAILLLGAAVVYGAGGTSGNWGMMGSRGFNGPAAAQSGNGNYGPGMMGNGYGPGSGNYGPGMMGNGYGPGSGNYGPGMMGNGYGPGTSGSDWWNQMWNAMNSGNWQQMYQACQSAYNSFR